MFDAREKNRNRQRHSGWIGRRMAMCAIMIGLLSWCRPGPVPALAADQGGFQTTTEGSYTMQAGDSRELSKTLALFQAKRTGVEAAEKFYSRRDLISLYGKNREEIISTAADRVDFKILQDKWNDSGSSVTYQVRIRVVVQPSDFIEAEIETLQQEKKESADSLRKEMEPEIAAGSQPGYDIAGAHRRIRKGKLRPAIIYLDRLQSKYPNWSEIYELKALAFELSHEASQMQAALQKACQLGSTESCEQLERLAP